MGFKEIGSGISTGITTMLNKFHGAIFSAPDLTESATKFTNALEGKIYVPGVGEQGTFDPNTIEGQEIIDEARHKLLSARTAYNRAYGNSAEMRSADDLLGEDFGIDVTELIIDAQPIRAVTNALPSKSSKDLDDAGEDALRL